MDYVIKYMSSYPGSLPCHTNSWSHSFGYNIPEYSYMKTKHFDDEEIFEYLIAIKVNR